jgi:hypothetical protein
LGHTLTIFEFPGIANSSLHLAAFLGNIKTGFQIYGIYPFNIEIFHDEQCMWAYVTDISTPAVAAADSSNNSDHPETSTDLP